MEQRERMHELTKKLWDRKHSIKRDCTFDDYDEIITQWLKEKALEMKNHAESKGVFYPLSYMQEILGLQPSPASVNNEEIVKKLDSMKNEKTVTVGSSEGAREHLKSLMSAPSVGQEWDKVLRERIAKIPKGDRLIDNYAVDMFKVIAETAEEMMNSLIGKPRPESERTLEQELASIPFMVDHPVNLPDRFFKKQATAAKSWMARKVRALKERIEDHHEKFYKECPRCIEIFAVNHKLDELLKELEK